MTDPADLDQLRNTISSQGATIGSYEEILRGLMEGFQDVAERPDLTLDTLWEQFCGLPTRQATMTVTSQPLCNPAGSSAVTPVSRNPAYLPQSATMEIPEPAGPFFPSAPSFSSSSLLHSPRTDRR